MIWLTWRQHRKQALSAVIGLAAMRSLARASMDAGAAGVMIAPPPHLRTDDQIIGYFKQAVEAIGSDIPWVLQDYPLTLSVVFTPAVIRKIVMDNPSCVMLKHEDWPGLEKISALRGFQKDGSMRPLSILTGNGGLFLDTGVIIARDPDLPRAAIYAASVRAYHIVAACGYEPAILVAFFVAQGAEIIAAALLLKAAAGSGHMGASPACA